MLNVFKNSITFSGSVTRKLRLDCGTGYLLEIAFILDLYSLVVFGSNTLPLISMNVGVIVSICSSISGDNVCLELRDKRLTFSGSVVIFCSTGSSFLWL